MKIIVLMAIVAWGHTSDGDFKELWAIEKRVTVEHCLTMNGVISGGGTAAVFTVTCKKISPNRTETKE